MRKILVLVDNHRHNRKSNSIKKYLEKKESFIKPVQVAENVQIFANIPRLQEILGVYHSKFIIVDSRILITGYYFEFNNFC